MTSTSSLKTMRNSRSQSQKGVLNMDPRTISRSVLEVGTEHVVSYGRTSQYNREGTGAAACGLAALNFARIVFLMEQDGLQEAILLEAVLARKCAEEATAICALWSGNRHLEVEDICRIPVFEKTLKLRTTIYGLPGVSLFKTWLTDLSRIDSSAVAIITRPPEILACLKLRLTTRDVFVIFDSHPRPSYPSGAGMIVSTSIEGTARRLTELLPTVDLPDGALQWQAQLLSNCSGHVFVPHDVEMSMPTPWQAVLESSLAQLSMQAEIADLRSPNGFQTSEQQRLESEFKVAEERSRRQESLIQRLELSRGNTNDHNPRLPTSPMHSWSSTYQPSTPSSSKASTSVFNNFASSPSAHSRSAGNPSNHNSRPLPTPPRHSSLSMSQPSTPSSSKASPSHFNNFPPSPSAFSRSAGFRDPPRDPPTPPPDYDDGPSYGLHLQNGFDAEGRAPTVQRSELAKSMQQLFKCGICMEDMPEDSIARPDPCGHPFCRDCLRGHVSAHPEEHRSPILCPTCTASTGKSKGTTSGARDTLVASSRDISRSAGLCDSPRGSPTPFDYDDGLSYALHLQNEFGAEGRALTVQRIELAKSTQRLFKCGICMEDMPEDSIARPDPCGHPFCRDCLRGHVSARLEEHRFPMLCPTCTASTGRGKDTTGAGLHDPRRGSPTPFAYDDDDGLSYALHLQNGFDAEDRALTVQRTELAKSTQRLFKCGICMEDMPEDSIARPDSCGHPFCRDCLRGHVSARLEEHRFPIFCPTCTASTGKGKDTTGAGLREPLRGSPTPSFDDDDGLSYALRLQNEFDAEDRVLTAQRTELAKSTQRLFKCGICMEDVPEESILESIARPDSCGHPFCRDCLRGHVSARPEEHRFPILCPTCTASTSKGKGTIGAGLRGPLRGSLAPPFDYDDGLSYALHLQNEFDAEDRVLTSQRTELAKFAQRLFKCGVCMDDMPEDSIARPDPCGHPFCRDCLRGHVSARLEEHRFPILCPTCTANTGEGKDTTGEVSLPVALNLGLTDQQYSIWTEMEMTSFSVLLSCRKCQQSMFVARDEHEEAKIIVCPLPGCNHVWCKQCQRTIEIDGSKHSCDGTSELDHLMKQQGWKHCPTCKTPIQKTTGCNFMSCIAPACNTHFCYLCGNLIVRSARGREIMAAKWRHFNSNCKLF
ncbi:hypothetical protein BJV78DRAFT_525300 [Lactifluus subvellereus]|nr:hypothetical protein BJV78DRAFT_525300 [Lactifluus subvellereus]